MDSAFARPWPKPPHGRLYFASLLSEDPIAEAFGRARGFWQGWI